MEGDAETKDSPTLPQTKKEWDVLFDRKEETATAFRENLALQDALLQTDPGNETVIREYGKAVSSFADFQEQRAINGLKQIPFILSRGEISLAQHLLIQIQSLDSLREGTKLKIKDWQEIIDLEKDILTDNIPALINYAKYKLDLIKEVPDKQKNLAQALHALAHALLIVEPQTEDASTIKDLIKRISEET